MEELIKKAQKGNKEAFTEIIYEIRHDLYKIARCRLSCEEDIEDAVQETMIEAYKEIKKLKYNQYFKTWIIKILINKCNKQYRKNKKENISYEYNNLENQIKENEIQTDIDFYIIISKLEYVERIIVTLYYLERYTTKEIAKILNKNENTIKTKLSRAKKKLRRYLEEEN